MKKFFAVMLLAVGIIFCSQLAEIQTASAADVYAYTEGGVEYYVTSRVNGPPYSGQFGAYVRAVSGGKAMKELLFAFVKKNGQWFYYIYQGRGGAVIEQGYLSNSGKAQTVFDITKKNF